MISFKVIKTSGDVSEFLTEISPIFESPDLLCEIEEMLLSYIEETEAEFAVSVAEACLLVRIYDGVTASPQAITLSFSTRTVW